MFLVVLFPPGLRGDFSGPYLYTMATILVTGGTGLIGAALTELLRTNDHKVIILTRRPRNGDQAHWDPAKGEIDAEPVRQADFIIHLAGAGVADKRWSEKRKEEIKASRVDGCKLIVKALREIPNKIQAVISSSAIGWYGPDPVIPNPNPFGETAPPDNDFLGETCRLWEEAIAPVTTLGKRLVIIRTGIVLSIKGGAFREFVKPVRLGIAAILGSGRQAISWIHIDDICRLFLHALQNGDCHGVYNGVAPHPVDNRTLTVALAQRLKGRYYVPVYLPSFLLKLMLGEMSIEVLKSTTVSAAKTHAAGFQFLYPTIDAALDNLWPAGGRSGRQINY